MKQFNKAKHLFLLPAFLLMAAVSAMAQPLTGTYTVGGTTPNYATLTDAVTALTTNGVSGPVIFNLRNGTYSGAQYTIPAITGASAANRITFQSETGIAANVTVSYAASGSGDNFVFTLNNASYLSFKNLTITNTASATYARAIVMSSSASYDSISNCAFSTTLTGSTSTSAVLVYATSFTGTDNVINGNSFTNGSYGVYLNGSSTSSFANRNVIQANTFTDQNSRAVFNQYANASRILGNTISTTRTNTYYGVYCQSSDGGVEVSGNTITLNNAGSGSEYGIYFSSCNGSSSAYSKIKNNTITINNTDYAYVYGIYSNSSPYDSLMGNTVSTTSMYGYDNYAYYNSYSPYTYSSGNTLTGYSNNYNAYVAAMYYSSNNSFFGNNTINITSGTSGSVYFYGMMSGSTSSMLYRNTINMTGRYTYGYSYNYMLSDASSSTVRKNTLNFTTPGIIYSYIGNYNSSPTIDSNDLTLTSTNSNYNYLYNYMGYNCSNGSISNNKLTVTHNYICYGMKCDYANNITFNNNNVKVTSLTTMPYICYAVYAYGTTNCKFTNNKIYSVLFDYNYGQPMGLYLYYSTSPQVINNSIATKSRYGGECLTMGDATNYLVKNNTLYREGGTSGYGYALNASGYNSTGNSLVQNNVVLLTGAGNAYMIYTYNPASIPQSDYNLFYSPSNVLYDGYYGGSWNMSGWRAAWNRDKNSLIYNAAAAMPNRATGNLTPDPTTPEVWAFNGRGIHDVANVPKDITGANRPANKPSGVPDLGAYEVLPTSIPPDCAASPAAPATGMQYFTFGQDTVASIDWTSATVPATATVKHYPGEAPISFSFPYYMYFHTDIDVPAGSYPHTANIYYKDPQTGTTAAESGLRLVKKLGTGSWTPFTAPASNTNATRNIISTTGLTDFGSHTGSDVANNASVSRLVSPTPTFCAPSTQTIKVTVKNTGNNTLNNVKIDWYMDGLFKGTVNYSTAINTFLVQPDSVQITLGTHTFTNARPSRLVAYSYLPNGVPDAANVDDTLKAIITPGLNGEYTIGGTPAPDFVDVKEAIDILNLWGVCGPTVFKIRDSVGAYNGAGVIKAPIIGGSTTNRVTFRSESGNAANVVVKGLDNNAVFGLDNVTDLSIKNITIQGLQYYAISMAGSPRRDTIRGCNLTVPNSTGYTYSNAVISSMNNSWTGRDNAIIGNKFSGSISSLYLYASGSSARDNVIDSNIFSSFYYYGPYIYYLNSLKFRGNTINQGAYQYGNMAYFYNLGTSGTSPVEIVGNNFNALNPAFYAVMNIGYYIYGTSTTRAKMAYNKFNLTGGYMYNYMCYGSSYMDVYNNDVYSNCPTSTNLPFVCGSTMSEVNIYNNTFRVVTAGSSSNYGLYLSSPYGSNCNIYNNTILTDGPSSNSYPMYFQNSSLTNMKIYNNIFANIGTGGNAIYWSNSASNVLSDYNNIFAINGKHFNGGGTVDTSLDNWRKTKSAEYNSISYNPGLIGSGNMHPDPANPASWSLNGRGIHMVDNVFDKDGQYRETDLTLGVPDIGAYEFEPTTVPPLAKAVPALPTPGATQVFTFGQDTVATLAWNPMTIVSNTIEVRQYSGRQAPSYPAGLNHMYFYTDVLTQNVSADYTANLYYKDHWMGTIGNEADLRLLKKLNPNPWVAYNQMLSTPDVDRNIITAPHVTSTGLMTGVEDGSLFSAVITPAGSATFCTGGNVQLDANVGAGYTYKWYRNGLEIAGAVAPSYVATTAGDYVVQITDPNAIPSAVTATSVAIGVDVIAPPAALISASGPLTYCTGGQLTLMANSGAGLWYQWQFNGNNIPNANNDSLSVTSSGNYSVTVNNIGCATTSNITTINQGPLHVVLGEDTSFCESQMLVLDAGYPGAHYLWSNGDTTQKIYVTTTSGDYSVFVDAGINCQARDTINVHIDPLPSLVGISYVSMGGSTFQFAPSGQLNTNSYMWMYSDGGVDFNQNTTHTFPANADWIATLIVFNDCGTDTSVLDLRALSVANVQNDASFSLYPNPASDKITLSSDKVKLSDVVIINNVGQVVYRGKEDNVKSTTIDITGMVDGHYIIRANTSDGKIISKPFDVLK
jgi:hypothetical protein